MTKVQYQTLKEEKDEVEENLKERTEQAKQKKEFSISMRNFTAKKASQTGSHLGSASARSQTGYGTSRGGNRFALGEIKEVDNSQSRLMMSMKAFTYRPGTQAAQRQKVGIRPSNASRQSGRIKISDKRSAMELNDPPEYWFKPSEIEHEFMEENAMKMQQNYLVNNLKAGSETSEETETETMPMPKSVFLTTRIR